MSNELTRYGSDGAPLAGGYWVTHEEAASKIEELEREAAIRVDHGKKVREQNLKIHGLEKRIEAGKKVIERTDQQLAAAREDSSHWEAAVRDALDTAEANKYDGGAIARMALQVIAKALREAIDAAKGGG